MSDSGISNMASKRSFSRMALNPRAPVFFLMASLATLFSALGVKVSSTYAYNNDGN
jgi:myo-inositol-1-phosphate synthase